MNKKLFAYLISVVVISIPFIINPSHNHNDDLTVPVILTFIVSVLLVILFRLKFIIAAALTMAGGVTGVIVGLFVDWHYDPTSHNLFPIEVFIDAILLFITSMIGAGIGIACNKLLKRDKLPAR